MSWNISHPTYGYTTGTSIGNSSLFYNGTTNTITTWVSQPVPTKIETLEDAKRVTTMCPHCGKLIRVSKRGCWPHKYQRDRCPGSNQIPRNAEADKRQLWNGLYPPSMQDRKPSEGRW